MAGVKGRSGGARPGSGQKSTKTEDYQATMRAIVEEVVTPDDWRYVVKVALGRAKAGDPGSRAWLSPFVWGAEPKEVTVKGDQDHPFVFVIE
jgi:hypothetical protein